MSDIEQAAREMGWRPKEEFKGDPDKWIDATEFVRRGENFVPLLRKENATLKSRLEQQGSKISELESALSEARDAMSAFKEFQTAETRRQVEAARRELVAQIKQAREAGDVDAEVSAQVELTKVNAQLAEKPKEDKPAAKQEDKPAPKTDPHYEAWLADNPWFADSPRKRALALGIAEELRADPANKALVGRAFYDRITEEVDRVFAERKESKVDGGRPAGSASSGGDRKRAYSDLPADAKAVCDRQAERLVGKGRMFATQDEWRAHYAKVYFSEE